MNGDEMSVLPVALVCVALGCARGAPEAEEPTGNRTEDVQVQEELPGSVPDERTMTLEQVLMDRNDQLQDCLAEHKQQHPEDGSLAAHFSVDHCGNMVLVETVIGDHAIDECFLRVLKDAQLAKQETCSNPGINKTYKILHSVAMTR